MRIVNGQILLPYGKCCQGVIEIERGLITAVCCDLPDAPATFPALPGHTSVPSRRGRSVPSGDLDAHGWIISPGWIDLQINGGFGYDLSTDPTALWEVAAQLPQHGVTAFLPTIISSPAEVYTTALEVLHEGPPSGWQGACPAGYHFEGPFLNPEKKGAHHPQALILPDLEFCRGWSRKEGVTLVTLAPELPGALALAEELAERGISLSAGHSQARLEEAHQAVEHGFQLVTHLFNAMPPLDHRAPGLAGAALLEDRLTAELIADGIHVHPEMVKLAWKLKGAAGIALITDAVGALGFAPGKYLQGGMEIVVDESVARLKDGTLAGSILTLEKALQHVMDFTGSEVTAVLPSLSATPARAVRLTDRGAIQPGNRADLTLVDEAGQVRMTIIGGEQVYCRL